MNAFCLLAAACWALGVSFLARVGVAKAATVAAAARIPVRTKLRLMMDLARVAHRAVGGRT
jgi:hypothetical protein